MQIKYLSLFFWLFLLPLFVYSQADPEIQAGNYEKDIARLDSLGLVNSDAGKFEAALQYYDRAIVLRQQYSPENMVKMEELIYNKGTTYMEMDHYKQSLACFRDGLKMLEGIDTVTEAARAYNYQAIGVAYRCLGDYVQAEKYFDQALSARLATFGDDHPDVAATYLVMGRLYKELGDYDQALDFLNKSLDIRQRKEPDRRYVVTTYNTIAITLGDMGRYQEAIDTLQKALKLQHSLIGADHPHVARTLNQMGEMHLNAGSLAEAEYYLQKALEIQLANQSASMVNPWRTYLNFARLRFDQGNLVEAIAQVENGLEALGYTAIDRMYEVTSPYYVSVVLGIKADFYRQAFERSGLLLELKEAETYYYLALRAFEYAQQEMKAADSNMELINKRYEIFEGALHAQYLLARQGVNEKEAIARAFAISEQSKSFLLRQIYLQSYDPQMTGIPDSLLVLERHLNYEIAGLRKKIDLQGSPFHSDEPSKTALQQLLFDLELQREKFLDRLSVEYPRYFRLKYNTQVTTMQAVQKSLQHNQRAVVEYFVGNEAIYVLLIQAGQYELIRIELDFDLEGLVKQLRDGILTAARGNQQDTDPLNQQYLTAATILYQKIFAPFASRLVKGQELMIIPDGPLGFLPFEVLLTAPPTERDGFRNYPYLVHDFLISYEYSATVAGKSGKKALNSSNQTKVLFVAPFAGEDPAGFQTRSESPVFLNHEAELAGVQTAFDTEVLLNQKATQRRFLELANDYTVLHLATHGIANAKTGIYSYLYFFPADSLDNSGQLYAADLYHKTLNADLVFLSACETGYGEWRRGEGMISLAHGFRYAGVNSIIGSLWKVENESTGLLTATFYKYLAQGKAKHEALRLAKIDLLQNSPFIEPFYWAGFIALGDTEPLVSFWDRIGYLWVLMPIFGLFIFVITVWRNLRNT